MTRNRSESGVTLVELMIAITLVAAISSGMLMAIRSSLVAMEKTDKRLQWNRRVMSMEQILTRQIGGVMPVVGECQNSSGAPSARVAVFSGTPQTMHLVSSYSMAEGSRGYPHLLEFQVIPGESGEGFRLIVNEYLYAGPSSTASFCMDIKYLPGRPNPQSFVIADRLAACQFSYRATSLNSIEGGDWLTQWDRRDLPSAIRIEMTPLDRNSTQLPMMGITVPMHINRQVGVSYDTP